MRIIITGFAGFVGSHLSKILLKENHQILGIDLNIDKNYKGIEVEALDLKDKKRVENVVKKFGPERIYHLAAQSSVSYSWHNPIETFKVNVFGGINLLEAVREYANGCRVLVVCTAEEYGQPKGDMPIREDFNIFPSNPYAISKSALDFFSITYSKAYHLSLCVTRSFNHIGPGQSERFVCSDFAKQIAKIENGLQQPEIRVGNLEAYRDFLDVRDVVRAYVSIMDKGKVGHPYNVCSGKKVKISGILKILISLSNENSIKVQVDPDKFRPIDVDTIYGDNSKLKKHTGWTPYYSLRQSLEDTLNYWRDKIKKEVLTN